MIHQLLIVSFCGIAYFVSFQAAYNIEFSK